MGGLFLMICIAISFLYMKYGSDIQKGLDNIEISNNAKQIMANAKTSQEQMLLKGEPNLFTNFISEKVSSSDQKVLNRVYYELQYNKNINNNDISDVIAICTIVISKAQDITLDECKSSLNKTYNFNILDSTGIKVDLTNYKNNTDSSVEILSAIDFLNKSKNLGYNTDLTSKKTSLSNNNLYQFDASLKEIEYMASGNNNYVTNDSVTFKDVTNDKTTTTNKASLTNLINVSLSNKNSLESNISTYNESGETLQSAISNKDLSGNIVDLISEYNDSNFENNNSVSNLDVVNSFESNKSTTRQSFTFYK